MVLRLLAQVVQLLPQGLLALPQAMNLPPQGLEVVVLLQGLKLAQALIEPLAQGRGGLVVMGSQMGVEGCQVMKV